MCFFEVVTCVPLNRGPLLNCWVSLEQPADDFRLARTGGSMGDALLILLVLMLNDGHCGLEMTV